MNRPIQSGHYTIRGAPIRVVRVVVVDVAGRVDIPRIISVAAIRRAKAHILFISLCPLCFIDNRYSGFYPFRATGPRDVLRA